jgi:Lon protease-like protein
MEIPSEAPVMTLPGVILFPQALLPLYIFEPRYRQMLADVLASHRMFCVAMQQPEATREEPAGIAGLGLVRVSLENPDGTSHLILHGLTRVRLVETVRRRPYRIARLETLPPANAETVMVDALIAKVRELVAERIKQGFAPKLPILTDEAAPAEAGASAPAAAALGKGLSGYLDTLEDGDRVVDLVSCTLLSDAHQRQQLLETVDVEERLKHLIHFLMAEIRRHRKKS